MQIYITVQETIIDYVDRHDIDGGGGYGGVESDANVGNNPMLLSFSK